MIPVIRMINICLSIYICITKKCVFNNLKTITHYYNNGFEEDIYIYNIYIYIYNIYIYNIQIYRYIYIYISVYIKYIYIYVYVFSLRFPAC